MASFSEVEPEDRHAHLRQGTFLDLADAFPGHNLPDGDLVEGEKLFAVESEPGLQDRSLPCEPPVEIERDVRPAQGLRRVFLRLGQVVVQDQL